VIARISTPQFAAELSDDRQWQCDDPELEGFLQLMFDPQLPQFCSPALGKPGRAAAVAAAAHLEAHIVWGQAESPEDESADSQVVY